MSSPSTPSPLAGRPAPTNDPPPLALARERTPESSLQAIADLNRGASRLSTALILLVALIFGVGLTFAAFAIQAPTERTLNLLVLLLNALGTTIIVSGSLSVIYDWVLRRKFLIDNASIVETVIREVMDGSVKNTLAQAIDSSISNKMPSKYTNLSHAGIDDAFSSLHVGRWKQKLRKLSGFPIRVLKIYIPDMREIEPELFWAIQHQCCSAQILLLNPASEEVLEKRAQCLHNTTADDIRRQITENIRVLQSIWLRLTPDRQHALQLRLHTSFVAVSLHGQAEEFTVGLYLRGRTATQGVQIRVRGAGKELFQHLHQHFEQEWTDARCYDFATGSLLDHRALPENSCA